MTISNFDHSVNKVSYGKKSIVPDSNTFAYRRGEDYSEQNKVNSEIKK